MQKKWQKLLLKLTLKANIIDPTKILTQKEPMIDAIEAYKQFDLHKPGWIKIALKP